jgi:hypothetical protein
MSDILYHYTTQQGLLGIIQSECLWATHCKYLNDKQEFRQGIELVKAALDQLQPTAVDERRALDELKSSVHYEWPRGPYYVCSFSEARNDLAQWRAYGGDGTGYAIGFAKEAMSYLLRTGDVFEKCIYAGKDNPHDRVTKWAKEALAWQVKNHGNSSYFQFMELYQLALLIKHPAFEHEQEWRLIRKSDEGPADFRVGKGVLVPYRNIEVGKTCGYLGLREIVLGPKLDPDLAEQSVRWLLGAHGCGPLLGKNIQVSHSGLPYR